MICSKVNGLIHSTRVTLRPMVVLLPLGLSYTNHHLNTHMIEFQYQEILIKSAHGTIAFAVGYVFYRLLKAKIPPVKITEHGRNWMAWSVLFACVSSLVAFTTQLSWVFFLAAITMIVISGFSGYIAGVVYGVLNKFRFIASIKNTAQDFYKRSNLGKEHRSHKHYPAAKRLIKLITTPAFYLFMIYFISLVMHNTLDSTKSFSEKHELIERANR